MQLKAGSKRSLAFHERSLWPQAGENNREKQSMIAKNRLSKLTFLVTASDVAYLLGMPGTVLTVVNIEG